MIKKLLLSLMLVSMASMGHVYAKNNVTLQGKGDAMVTVEQQPAQMPYADPGCVTHVVTFMNGGDTLKQYNVCEGEVPVYDGPTPWKESTKEHVYSFDGWDKVLQPVGNSDITYNAMFSESMRKYTIRFYDEDGMTLLSEKEVEYGQFPTYTEPTKPSTPEWEYSFASWDPAMTAVTDDASYRAKYNATKREYIITFLDNDGTTILSAKNWKYGETPTCSVGDKNITGGTVKFNRWEPSVTSVTGATTYTAVRDTVWNTYNVFFFNESAFLTMTMVEHGKTPVYSGPTPTKASDAAYAYEFSGWTPTFGPLTGPGPYFFYATFNAIPLNFTVTFRNYDGTLLKTVDNVAANTPVDGLYTGATPTRPSDDQYHYQFDGWTPAGPATSTNKEFTAKYKSIPRKYGITWKNYDGTTLRVDSLEWHAFPFYSATPTRPDDENYSYKFKSWTPAVSQVVGDAEYTATFEHAGYVIHFVNYNGIELYRKAYVYGETPAYVGPTPTKPKTPEYSYRFNGWIPGIGKVLGPQTYKADFLDIANKYWLQWDPNNGELSGTYTKDSVAYNTPILSPTITRVGYTFTGWTPTVAPTMPAANTTYEATWQPNPNTPYVVEHYRQALDGTYPATLKEVENFTGTTAIDVTPAVKSYTGFAAPPTETKTIAADGSTVVVYQYQRQSYTLTWITDGDALKGTYTKGSVLYEAPITPPDTPTKTGYTFAGWNEAVADKMPATNKTYTAQWNANNYTITFDKQGGTDGSNSVVATYEKPMPSIVKPNRQGYIFDGYFTQPQSLGVMYYNSSVMSMRNWDIPSETTLYAAWRPRDDTPYKVNHYLQNLNNSDYTLYTTENHIGITDKQVTPAVKTYPGFTSPATQTITILPDGSAVVDYKYTRNRYNIQWLTDGDALTGSYTQGSVLYETPIVKPDTPKKTGYTFATWEPDVPLTMPAEDKTFTAKWNPNTNTPYVVKHYRQALDGTYPAALMETENLTGTTATSVKPAVKTYTGFTSPATKTVTIAADGSTVVEYYYTRNKYTLTWVTDGNALTGSYTKGSILFETIITEPITPTKTGYTFAGWDNAVPITMPATDKTFTATWTPNTNTPYVVKHYRQALDGSYPAVLMETENLTGTTANNVTPVVKTYTGFTSPAPKTVTIAADGSTVVEYYYTRNQYTLTWVTDGDALTGSYTKGAVLFETKIIEPNTPTKTGYTFAGWDNAVPDTMPATDKTFTATWTPRDDTPYRVEHYLENEVGTYPTTPYEIETLKGTTDTDVTPAIKNYDGYIAPATQTKKIAADGSTVFVYQYKRNKFTLAWDANGGDPLTGSYSSGLITFGMAITAPNTPTRMGYHFTQWSPVFTGTMPAGNTTYKAQWEPNTNTPYVVKHYRQALDGTYPSTLMEVENLTGTTAASVTPAVKTYSGFTSPATKTVTIAANGSTEVAYYYTRNQYTLTWVTDGNALTGSYTKGSILFETAINQPNEPTKTGYTFNGWDKAVPTTMPASDMTLTAKWKPNTNTPYVVKHYRQALNGTYPSSLMEVENLTGTTAASVTPAVKTYTGFTSPAIKTVTIAADGSTEVAYYYTRNKYFLQWITDGDALTGAYTKDSVLFETTITEPATPTKTGYTFAGWNAPVPTTMPAGNKTFTATWTPKTNTPYVVKHYRQALDGTYPSSLMESENLTGTTANKVTPVVKTYTGFTSPAAKTEEIAADGSTVVEYYYTRNQYTLTWVTDGDALTGSYTKGLVLYEAPITQPNTPTKTGYTFAGWNETVPATMPATNKTFTAQWDANQYTITLDKQGGTGGTSSVLVTFDQTLPTIIAPTRIGYTFAGYYDAVEGNGTPYYNNSGVGLLIWTTASDGTLYAAWTPNTNTAYVVKHYRQALDGTYPSTLMEVENLTGTTAASVKPAVKIYTGFTSPAAKTVTIAADGTTEVAYYYTRNKYLLQWITDGNALTGAYTKDSVLFETPITQPNEPTKTGYLFNGWKGAPVATTMPAQALTYEALWKPDPNTPYAVHHYQLNLDGSRPATPTEIENFTDTTGTLVTPMVKTYEGFTSPAPKTVTIAADGSTVVEYEYTRNSYTLSWNANGGTLTGTYTQGTVFFGTPIVAPTPVRVGYTFTGWDTTPVATMPASNLTYTAQWTPNTNTPYVVEHYLPELDGTYTRVDVDSLTGTTGVTVKPETRIYTGFTPPTKQTKTIAANGSTIVKYYYTRNTNKLSWTTDGNPLTGSYTRGNAVPYETPIVAPDTPTKTGYMFAGWNPSTIPPTMPDNSLSFEATWTPKTNTPYTVEHYLMQVDGTFALVADSVQHFTGTTADSVKPAVLIIEGFTSPAPQALEIFAEGDAVLKYRYTRNQYNLTWIVDGAPLQEPYTHGSVYYQTPIVRPADPIKVGYTFTGWNPSAIPATMPTNNLTFEAQWDANTNTPYTVEHYLMQVDGTYSTTPDSVQHFTGTTADNIMPAMINFEGFSLPGAQMVTIAADGSTVVKYKYPRNKYFLEWITDGDALTGSYSKDWLFFGTKIIKPNTPIKTGYTFNTWLPTVAEYMPSMPTTYTATWTPNPNTPYVVKHYQQQLDGSYLTTPTDVDNLTGTTADSITPLTKDYEGFTAPLPQTTTIAADGSTVVEYYYTRNTYYLAWETDGDALTGTYTDGDVLYGTPILAPNAPTKTGYTFAGWDKPIASTMPADSTIYTATWTPNPNTPYTVEHYQQLLNGAWPTTPNDVDNLTGTTASIVTPAVKTYEGFTSPTVDTVAILADGSLTVRYYYLRNSYNLTWTTSGNPLTGAYTQGLMLYGETIVEPLPPTKVGYTFTGWNPPTIPTTMPAQDLTFVASFDPNTNTQYVVNHYLQDLDLTHYTLIDTDTLYGTSDAKVTVPVNMYAGFDTIAPVQITIAADGSSVLDYYYNRQTYLLSWDAKGGTLSGTYTAGAVLYQAPIVAPTATRTGYTFAVWAPAFSTIPPTMPHGDVTYGAQWTANHYVVDLDHQGGSSSTNAVMVTYDSLMPPVEVPTKVGYTFAGYYEATKGVGTQYYIQDGSSVHLWNRASDTIIFAHWTPNPNTPYTVEHYQQQLDGTWPTTPEDIDYLTGTTDAYVKPTYKAYEGFTAQDADSAAILADGSLVIRCYYLRNTYNLTWTTDGNPLTGSYTSGATLYGEAIVLPDTPTKVGYTFKAWDKTIPATMPAQDLTFAALFDPNPNTPYIVNHYLQDLDLTHYTLVDIDTLYGTSDAKVTVPVNMYAGFDTIAPVEITIAADGSSVLDYYYNRQTYVLSWDAKGGTLSGTYTSGAVLYQAPIVAPLATRTGYTFAVWAPAFSTIPPTMPHGDVTYEAQWTANKYVVDLDHQGGSSSMGSVLVTYDSIMPAVEVPVLPGYFFKGYYTLPNGQGSQYYLDNGNSLQVWNVDGDTVVYAHWTPDPNTPYVVEHYQQNLDGTTYPTTPTEVDNLSDTTNIQVIPAVRTYEGFTSPEPDTIIVTADTITVVRYYYERNPYNLTWDANEGTLSGTYDSGVTYYDAPIVAPMANRLGYTFNEWLPTFTGNMPAAHTTYVAQWTPNTNTPYTVEHYLQNMDCTTYPTTPFEVDHLTGTTDTKVVPEVKNYPGFTAPEKDSLLVAADGYAILRYYYERNVYPVVFINETDTLLKLQLPYDSMPHYEGVIPTREANAQYTYTWNGNWKPMIHPVDGINDNYQADFDSVVNQYVITFMYDTDTVQVDTLDYGTLPTYQGQPLTKDSTEQWAYQFAGWDPTIVTVTQDTTYYARFDSTLVEYNISFYNHDSTLVLDTLIAYGTMPVCDSIPTKDTTPEWTYIFAGWEPTLELVTRDTAYYARFDSVPTYYQITFLNWNDTILQQDSFTYASIPVCDVIPYKEPDAQYTYTFAGWEPAIVPVDQDTVYKALFDSIINEYFITFVCDGDTLQADSLAYGTMPEYVGKTPTRDSTAQYSFTFVGWTPQVDTVRMDRMYEATFDSILNQYQITFVNWNDTILQQSMWNYGDMPFYNGVPVKDTTAHFNYQFAGWEPFIEPVICDTIYKAVFDSIINPDECYCDSAPAVELYDWFLILDVNSLYAMGYTFSAEDVTWYRVTGAEPDTMGTPAYDRKDEIVGRGFHFTPETPLVGTGSYYAEITLPKQIADVLCQDFMRTRIFTFTNTRLLLAPSIVYPHESLHLYGLPEGVESTLHIYDATGKLVDVMKTTSSHISWNTPVTGTYMILVQSQDIHEVLKYIVK